MDTLTIDRGAWLTGTARNILGQSSLRNPKCGLMCCLGFYARQLNLANDDIDYITTMTALGFKQPNESAWLRARLTPAERKTFHAPGTAISVQDLLTQTNDQQSGIHPARREAKIAKVFKHFGGIEVKFTGDYGTATKRARGTMPAAA